MSSLRTAEDGHPGLYVLGWPLPGDTTVPRVAYRTALAVPILSREGGYLLAIPLDFLPSDVLVGGLNLEEDGVVGPSMMLEVPAVEEDEVGEEVETGTMITVLLVDFTREVERGMTEFDPELGLREIQPFWQDAPEVLPSSKSLVESAIEWSRSEMDSRVHYYSAAEEDVNREAQETVKPAPKRSAAIPKEPKPKKVTNAVLADQVANLAASLPALMDQVQRISEQQQKFEEEVKKDIAAPRVPAYRMPFGAPEGQVSEGGARRFAALVGSPPQARGVPLMNTPQVIVPEDEPTMAPDEEGFPVAPKMPGDTGVATALAQQTQAMTALVAHLVGQADLSDLTSGSSSSALTSKGSTRREKLQNDLASRTSCYLLQVAQLAARRMKPSEPLPSSLGELKGKALFTKHLVKHGGYSGQKELGYLAWLVSHIADCFLAGDNKGAQEITALTLCAIDQACQDNGRWDLALLLALVEEPPPGVFCGRGSSANPRMKAFSPLVPQGWATTTISYVREMDLIASRRLEAAGSTRPKKEEDSEQPAPKRRPRFPKKPKGGGES